MQNFDTLWIRAETKSHEERCPVVPRDAKKLIADGVRIVYEDSKKSCFQTSEFQAVGCDITPAGSWVNAPQNTMIVAIKELPDHDSALSHHHLYFAHAYKGQASAAKILSRFRKGGGVIWDWEYLCDDQNRRLIAFGYWAGFAGALIATQIWLRQRNGRELDLSPTSREQILPQIRQAMRKNPVVPKALIMGALGRCGTGARDCFTELGIPVTGWDKQETQSPGPYTKILQYPIFLNAVLASSNNGVFLDHATINMAETRALSVIVDVSCDPGSPYNPLPLYEHASSFDDPFFSLRAAPKPLDLSAIDHLPSLLPRESSEDFSAQALPFLRQLCAKADAEPWISCYKAYQRAIMEG